MSAGLKLMKKKYSQQELRRIMSETKAAKQVQQSNGNTASRIDSPLAKYNEAGQLSCVLCRSVVRSENVWKVHINSKQHKEHIELTKKLKETPVQTTAQSLNCTSVVEPLPKRFGAPIEEHIPAKKLKGILKNSKLSETKQDSVLPLDFFDNNADSTGVTSSIRKELVNLKLPDKHRDQNGEPMEQNLHGREATASTLTPDDEKLPEGFFDDPKMDAKARNQEYKDPNDEEWEKFQKEIKEATNISMAIISEEQEESTAERQIAEIDEQIRNWSRVLDLEKKKELMKTMKDSSALSRGLERRKETTFQLSNIDDGLGDDDDEEFDEFLDWRAKKSYR